MSSTQRRSRTAGSGGAAHTDGKARRAPAPGGERPARPTRAQRIAALATVRAGEAHADLEPVQRFLRRFGFLGADEAVQAGRLDRPTSDALRRYQRQRQLPETGDFDAATRAELAQPVCGTPDRRSGARLKFNTPVGAWDRRDFRYTFTTAPGSSGTLTQTLSFADAKAAVNRAFATWSKVDAQLRFTAVALNQNPDVFVEWVPFDHSQQAKDDTNGSWELPDSYSLDDQIDPAAAHADFPPRSITGDPDGNIEDPPLCLHFDDEEELWDDDRTFRVALHEIGHILGLDHFTPPPPEPGEAPQRAVMEPQLWSYSDLQDDDRAAVRSLYTVPGPERFNFIWMKGTLERRAEWGVTPDDIEDTIEAAREEGFQPARLNAYVLPDGGRRYNVVLERLDQDRHWVGAHTRPDFDQKRGEYEGQGYRLIDVTNVVGAGGEALYNAVWARNGVNMVAFVGLDLVELEQTIEQFKALRYRPSTINGYQTPGGESGYNLIMVKQGELGDGRFWRASWNATRDVLFAAAEQNEADGYTPTDLNTLVLRNGGGERWNGIWEKMDPQPDYQRQGAWVGIDAQRRTALLEKQGVAPWVLNAYVRPSPTSATTTAQPATLDQAPAGRHAMALGLAVDERRVYATRSYQLIAPPHTVEQPGLLVVLDRETLQPVPELPQLPGRRRGVAVGHDPRSVAVNRVTGKIYVANRGQQSFSLSVIDGATLAVRKTIALGIGPVDVAVNPRTNRIYVSNLSQHLIQVVDGATDALLAPIPIGPGPLGMAVDETTNTLYVALCNRAAPPFVNGLGAVVDDGVHRQILPVVPIDPLGIDSQDVAVDPVGDRIYVVNQGNVGAGPASLAVFHRPSRARLATVPLPSAARSLALNADAGEVYVTADSGVVHVVDTVSLTRTSSVPTGKGPWSIAAAPGTARRVFVGDRVDGSVVRLS